MALTKDARKVWKSPGGASLLEAWMEGRAPDGDAEKARQELRQLQLARLGRVTAGKPVQLELFDGHDEPAGPLGAPGRP